MIRKLPALSDFLSKLLYELVPAAIASAIGGLIFSHYAKTPVATPAAAISAQASAELIQMVRDEHVLFVESLKKYTDARLQADLAAEGRAKSIKAADEAVAPNLREAKAIEARMPIVAAHIVHGPEKRLASIQPAQTMTATAEPLQLHPMPNAAAAAGPSITPVAPTTDSDEGFVAATVQRIPSWLRAAAGWFAETTPPRPPAQLSPRNFLNASM